MSSTLAKIWPANRRSLEKKATVASHLAHAVVNPVTQEKLFAVKHAALQAIFASARNTDPSIVGKLHACVDPNLRLKGHRVFSIRLQHGALHLPEVYAGPMIINLVNESSNQKTALRQAV
jgi:hypothetical protein